MGSCPLVFVPGWGFGRNVWREFATNLVVGEAVALTLDLPGFGPSATLDLDFLVRPTHLWPRARQKPYGSLGGLPAMLAACRYRRRVSALVLIAATPKFATAKDWPHAIASDLIQALRCDLLADPDRALKRFAILVSRGSGSEKRDSEFLISHTDGHLPHALLAWLEILELSDLRPQLRDVSGSTLVVLGANDCLVPTAVTASLLALCQNARVEIVPNAGHAPFVSHTHYTSRLLLEFLRDHHLDGRLSAG
jgi:pimeloyl-[acyl-carrier protein] methyl ester esterase